MASYPHYLESKASLSAYNPAEHCLRFTSHLSNIHSHLPLQVSLPEPFPCVPHLAVCVASRRVSPLVVFALYLYFHASSNTVSSLPLIEFIPLLLHLLNLQPFFAFLSPRLSLHEYIFRSLLSNVDPSFFSFSSSCRWPSRSRASLLPFPFRVFICSVHSDRPSPNTIIPRARFSSHLLTTLQQYITNLERLHNDLFRQKPCAVPHTLRSTVILIRIQ